MGIAAQAFTIRRELEADPSAAFARLRSSGFDAVELAGLAGRSATEIARALESAGVTAIAMHVSIDRLGGDRDAVADEAGVLGLRHLVVPSLGERQHEFGIAEYRVVARELDALGAELQQLGFGFHVHNHAAELVELDGVRPLDVLADGTGERVGFELDVGWLRVAGQDPTYWLRRLAGRVTFVHLKDVVLDDGAHTFRPLGDGVVQWREILAACVEAGVSWGIVEDDDALEGAYASLQRSRAHLDATGPLS